MKYKIAIIFIGFASICFAGDITIDNWIQHPEIKTIRKIVTDVEAEINNGTLVEKTRMLDPNAHQCLTYRLVSQSIYVDSNGVIRKYVFIQIVSDGDKMEIDRYYDGNKTLRFVYNKMNKDRIYLDASGKVIWSVESVNGDYEAGSADNENWEVQPINSDIVAGYYQSDPACPKF